MSRRSTASAAASGFAAEVRRGQHRYRSMAAASARYAGRQQGGPTYLFYILLAFVSLRHMTNVFITFYIHTTV